MTPGEYRVTPGHIVINEGRQTVVITVENHGDRPIQIGSHYHFFEVNSALKFDRTKTRGFRLNIPSGTAVRFEPGQKREVELVNVAGKRRIVGFRSEIMGSLELSNG
ncbi:urease subunit beta [Salmonella enterica subsp. enterica]|nr:urease subunit beta [Salmonella enterica subsp. enterica serovar Chailey]